MILCVWVGSVPLAWTQALANPPAASPCCDAIQQQLKAMEDHIILLEGQVRIFKEQLAQAQPSQAQATGPAPAGQALSTAAGPHRADHPRHWGAFTRLEIRTTGWIPTTAPASPAASRRNWPTWIRPTASISNSASRISIAA